MSAAHNLQVFMFAWTGQFSTPWWPCLMGRARAGSSSVWPPKSRGRAAHLHHCICTCGVDTSTYLIITGKQEMSLIESIIKCNQKYGNAHTLKVQVRDGHHHYSTG